MSAQQETLTRGVAAEAEPYLSPGGDPRSVEALLSVLIVSHRTRDELEACLASLDRERETLQLEVIVVDNGSTDGTVEMVAKGFSWVRLVANPENVGFARAANQAISLARGEYLLVLNPDTVVSRGALSAALAELRDQPEVGMLGCKLVRSDGSFDHACKRGFPTIASSLYYFLGLSRLLPRSPRFAHYTAGRLGQDEAGYVDAVNGAFMLVRRQAVEDVGPLDERFWLYAEDLDWCRRFWEQGWKILYWPEAEIVHLKGASAGERRSFKLNLAFHRSIWLFYEKHHAPIRSRGTTLVVLAGIWARFALSVTWNVTRGLVPSRKRTRVIVSPRPHPVRVVVHDYAGHPFQVHLSRELARRGFEVLHLHCPSYRSGKGALAKTDGDPDELTIEGVELKETFEKYSKKKRPFQEREYAAKLIQKIGEFSPAVVISSNTPLLSQWHLLRYCRRRNIRFVFWQQDINSIAIRRALKTRLPVIGVPIAGGFKGLEKWLVRRSDAVVVISEDFEPILEAWGVAPSRMRVVHNWAPLEELPVRPRDNDWARRHGLEDKRVLLYSGTLGLKHNPGLLLALGEAFRNQADVRIVVVSEGVAADWLERKAADEGLENLVVLPFQPYEQLPDVLASSDVLMVVLEADAAAFSVPSKVLSYHCAERALLAAVPAKNLAARTIERAGSGIVVDPADVEAFVAAAGRLLADPALRERCAAHARDHAVREFEIRGITDQFEEIIQRLCPLDGSRGAVYDQRGERWKEIS